MHNVAFHIDSAERTGGAKVFTSATANTFCRIDRGHLGTFIIHHLDGPGGTMSGTVAAADLVCQRDAVLLQPDSVSGMHLRLLLRRDRPDGPSRTHLTATGTLGTTIAPFEGHLRLHEGHQRLGWPQDVVRTCRHAKLACRAVVLHILR